MGKRKKNTKELQILLDGLVEQYGGEPPVQTQSQVLPLNSLTWENFERLCARLITNEAAVFDCFRYGKQGEDQQGIDILARRWMDGRLEKWVYQCKRYQAFTESDARSAVGSFSFEADVYVILVSSTVSAGVRAEIATHESVQLWDQEDISRRLKDQPGIVSDFFSRSWQIVFAGNSSKPPADSTQAAIRRAIGLDLSHTEWLHSNLLPSTRFPEKIYKAATPLRPSSATTGEEMALIPPYKLSRDKNYIWSFANLKDSAVAALVGYDPKQVAVESVTHFISIRGGYNIIRDLFYENLRRKCASLGMAYDEAHHRFYFTPLNGGPRSQKYKAYKRTASRKLAYPYFDKETGELRFWVHQAVRLSLSEAGGNYYLRVEPGYAFTREGSTFMASEDIGPLTTRRKSGERNQNVFNHLMFWRSVLLEPNGAISLACGDQEFLFSSLYESVQANFGIPYDSQPVEEIAVTEDEFDLEMMLNTEAQSGSDSE